MGYLLAMLQNMTQTYMNKVEAMLYSEIISQDDIDFACEISPEVAAIDALEHYLMIWKKLTEEPAKSTPNQLKHFKLFISDAGLLNIDTEHYHSQVQYSEREAMKLAGAILQLSKGLKWQYLEQGIGAYLMRPFVKAFPFPSVQQIGGRFRQYVYHCKRQQDYAQTKDEKLQFIQRFWRKEHYARARPKRIEPNTVEMDDSVRESCQAVIRNPQAPKPLAIKPGQNRQAWIRANRAGDLAKAVEDIADSIYYRSHAKFMKRLEQSVEKFNDYIYSLPEDKRHYVIVVPGTATKSNHWVTGLALPFLRKKPAKITTVNELSRVQEEQGIEHCVVIDDAIYSGKQMSAFTREIPENMHISAILPFYTKRGLMRVGADVNYFIGERMLSPNEVHDYNWRGDRAKTFNKVIDQESVRGCGQYYFDAAERVGTFFAHKCADETSTFLDQARIQQEGGDSAFLPWINKPY